MRVIPLLFAFFLICGLANTATSGVPISLNGLPNPNTVSANSSSWDNFGCIEGLPFWATKSCAYVAWKWVANSTGTASINVTTNNSNPIIVVRKWTDTYNAPCSYYHVDYWSASPLSMDFSVASGNTYCIYVGYIVDQNFSSPNAAVTLHYNFPPPPTPPPASSYERYDDIPTLPEWGVLIMGSILAVTAFLRGRSRRS
ncbi:MAG: IPTL-CTERM sorting domain-containing protein [Pseudomonadota bacterium]